MADKRLTFTSWFLLVLAAAFFGAASVAAPAANRVAPTGSASAASIVVMRETFRNIEAPRWFEFATPSLFLAQDGG